MKLSTWLDITRGQLINMTFSNCEPTPLRDIPLGNLVGGAFRAHAYIMEGSSSQVPFTLPQSLEIEMTQSIPLFAYE